MLYLSSSFIDLRACPCTFAAVLEHVLVDEGLVEGYINAVPGGHQMVVVDHLHKWLDFGSFCNFLLSHGFGDFAGVFIDSSHQGVTVWAVLCSVVIILDDDSFTACIFATQHQNYLP